MTIESLTEQDSLLIRPMFDQFSTSSDGIFNVNASYFKPNHNYKFQCTARNEDNNVYGLVSKQYNSNEFLDKIGIGVSPARGVPFSTIFSIWLVKPSSEALKCVIGYKYDEIGEVLIEDLSGASSRFSSQYQAV